MRNMTAAVAAAILSVCFASSGAGAADTLAPQAPVADWSGVYLGVHGGYGAFGVDFDEAAVGPFTVIDRDTPDGLLGGVALGYDVQTGSWVYGAEVDFSLSSVDGHQISDFFGAPARTDVDLDWLATVRGRVGYAATDRLLVYGTAGLAMAHVTEVADLGGGLVFENDNTHLGVAVGAGAEWMLFDGVSARAEALYVHLAEETYGTILPADASGYGVIGRIGIGVRF